ncbi:MAG: fatty-acid--CoA ligase, partial [Sphingomonadales bacterium]
MMRLTQLLDASRRRDGGKVAIIDGDKRLTYDALYERTGRCAGMLQGLGVGAEDRV